jgi:ribosomal protein S18 acetylase RimI-like enzyme
MEAMAGAHGKTRPLDFARIGPAAELLAAAFRNEPIYAALVPEEEKRAKLLSWLFGRLVRHCLLYGRVDTTPAMEGVACWLPPGRTSFSIGRALRSGLWATPLHMGLATYRRFDAFMRFADGIHTRSAPGPHWYFVLIGTDPSSRGRGVASTLTELGIERATAEGLPCYGETGHEALLPFWKRFGLEVVEEGLSPVEGVRVWGVLRPFPPSSVAR